MSRRCIGGAALGIALAFASIAATGQATPPYGPRFERPIITTAAGPQRLAVDLPLLTGAAPFPDVRGAASPRVVPPRAYGGLSDLRLFAADGREIGYLLTYGDAAAAREPLKFSLPFERRPSEPGRSRYRVRLPHAPLPIVALLLNVGGDHVFRTASVTESRLAAAEAAPVEIGRATLSRIAHDASTPTELRIPIVPPREPELDLVVEDGNNPPFDLKGMVAACAELPWIYFEAPGGPIVARYGDAHAAAPMYDLEVARSSIRIASVPDAGWGEPRAIVTASPAPAAPIPDTGAPIDAAGFRIQRTVPEGPAGLVALEVDASVLAQSRGGAARFADVRIIDAAGRQVPYLVERREEPLTLDLALKPFAPKARELKPESGGHRSVYSVRLPYTNLPPFRMVLETSARVFQRPVQVGVERPPDRQRRDAWFDVNATSVWQHADESTAAPALTLPVHVPADLELVIAIEEGDNRPLPVTAARALLPSYRLRFYHPGGPLRLVYGHDGLDVPQYDLALLGNRVMGSAAREVRASAPPESAAAAPSPPLVSPRTFWIGLTVAVLVLAAIIAKLTRSQESSAAASRSAGPRP